VLSSLFENHTLPEPKAQFLFLQNSTQTCYCLYICCLACSFTCSLFLEICLVFVFLVFVYLSTLLIIYFSFCKSKSGSQDLSLTQGVRGEKVLPGIVLLLAQLSLFIGRSAIPRITKEIASSFSSGGARGYEYGPAFIPVVICRTFRVAGEKCLDHYVRLRTQKISVLLRTRFTTPNWVKVS
ncbi:unnamed protein product, partial [Coffea canephora]